MSKEAIKCINDAIEFAKFPPDYGVPSLEKALALLEAEPEPGEFTKAYRADLKQFLEGHLGKYLIVDGGCKACNEIDHQASRIEHLLEKVALQGKEIDRLTAENKELTKAMDSLDAENEERFKAVSVQQETLVRLQAALQAKNTLINKLVEYTAQNLNPNDFMRLCKKALQALKEKP